MVKRAAVVVLGDIGHSPRMQYHALSLGNVGYIVDIIAYEGSLCRPEVEEHPAIHKVLMHPWTIEGPSIPGVRDFKSDGSATSARDRATHRRRPRFLSGAVATPQTWVKPHVFSMDSKWNPEEQNPSSERVLVFVRLFRRSKIIVDWHNLGYTILGLSLGQDSFIVSLAQRYEKYFGSKADGHLCVTKSFQKFLREDWRINAKVLYDQPPPFFRPTSVEDSHKLFIKLSETLNLPVGKDSTFLTEVYNREVRYKHLRPALLVSSTSWTPDEDFGILLDALVLYDEQLRRGDRTTPDLVVIITGKGPEKQFYEEKISKLQLRNVAIRTAWLETQDYPTLLGAADLGISLHASSSGLDLPMKVVDMFGCGVPVCAKAFACIDELVQDERNGLLFSTPNELAAKLLALLEDFETSSTKLKSLKKTVLKGSSVNDWHSNWLRVALPLIRKI